MVLEGGSQKLTWLNVMNVDEFIHCTIKGKKRAWELGYGGEVVGEKEKRNMERGCLRRWLCG